MASYSDADLLAADPPKLRRKPQRKGNIGRDKLYADEAAFLADVDAWKVEQEAHKAFMKEREREQDRRRDRSTRQRDGADGTDTERRVRQRSESAVQAAQHRDREADRRADLQAQEQATREQCDQAREEGIAAGRLIRMQADKLQFLDEAEEELYERHCPLGCPHAAPVCLRTDTTDHLPLRRCRDGALHVCIMLCVRKRVRVGGSVVGYGSYAIPMRRTDVCACTGCDEERRGIRFVHGRARGNPFGPMGGPW